MAIQTIKRAIVLPNFYSESHIEESARMQKAYSLLAQQVNAIQSQFQCFPAVWVGAVSPQVITLPVPMLRLQYAALAIPSQNVGAFWCDTRTLTTFNFNMAAPAAGGAFFLVVAF